MTKDAVREVFTDTFGWGTLRSSASSSGGSSLGSVLAGFASVSVWNGPNSNVRLVRSRERRLESGVESFVPDAR